MTLALRAAVAGSLLAAGGALVARAGLTLDIGVGRRLRPLGPIALDIAAPPELVFDVIAAPYLGRTPRALQGKLEVIERGTDLVLAAHFTPVAPGLTVTTLETVRFERPQRVTFRLVKGPVPHAIEHYELRASATGTAFEYRGELGTDLWALGAWWGSGRGAVVGADGRELAERYPHRGRATRAAPVVSMKRSRTLRPLRLLRADRRDDAARAATPRGAASARTARLGPGGSPASLSRGCKRLGGRASDNQNGRRAGALRGSTIASRCIGRKPGR